MAMSKSFDFMTDIEFGEEKSKSLFKDVEPENKSKEQKKEKPVEKTVKKEEEKIGPEEQKDDVIEISEIKLRLEKKETKNVHKNFLISEKTNKKLQAMAKKYGVSENTIVNEILNAFFGIDK